MNKFFLIATVIFALAGCCLAQIGYPPNWKTDPTMKPTVDAVCNANKRPDATQWTNLLNCSNPMNCPIQSNTTNMNKTADPKLDKYAETVCNSIVNDEQHSIVRRSLQRFGLNS
jgi:hypothetical protein